jgi:hypothetical protein
VRKIDAETIDPKADAFVANIYAALVEQILNIPERERKPDIHQYGELDNLWRGFEVAKRVLGHFLMLNAWKGRLKNGSSDNTYSWTGGCAKELQTAAWRADGTSGGQWADRTAEQEGRHS